MLCAQGDAAFWWNLKKSGEGDMLTRHAGCPVLVGSKWGELTSVVLSNTVLIFRLTTVHTKHVIASLPNVAFLEPLCYTL